jgi:hypothetical protein
VWSEYAGGKILKGYLVGKLRSKQLAFDYVQIDIDHNLNHGHSNCDIEVIDGRVRLVEHFEWATRPGGGTNIIEEMP